MKDNAQTGAAALAARAERRALEHELFMLAVSLPDTTSLLNCALHDWQGKAVLGFRRRGVSLTDKQWLLLIRLVRDARTALQE